MTREKPYTEDFDKAVFALYDAALGAYEWGDALETIGSLSGTMHENIMLLDGDTTEVLATRTGRLPELMEYWRREWAATGRCLRLQFFDRNKKTFAVDYDFIDQTGIRRSAYYEDLTRKYDFAYYVGCHAQGLIPGKPNIHLTFSLCYGRRHGHAQAPDLTLANRLLPHLKRAFIIELLLSEQAARQEAAQSITERIGDGIINVDAQSQILSLNSQAERLLQLRDGIRRCSGRLSACLHSDASALQSLIHETSTIDPNNPPKTNTIAVHRRQGKLPLLLTVAPLSLRSAEFLNIMSAGAVIHVSDPETEQYAKQQELMTLFRFTETEAQIAALFLRGMGVNDIARHSGTTLATVRFHFRNLFRKCNASGQVDLMRILKTGLS